MKPYTQGNYQELKDRLIRLEKRYMHNHRISNKPWYLSFSTWIAILCAILLIYILYIFYMHEYYGVRVVIPYIGEF